jgi:NADH:ubiquinone oxidoreductase subunit 6 (subunit J)
MKLFKKNRNIKLSLCRSDIKALFKLIFVLQINFKMLIFFYIFVGFAAFALLSTHDGFLLVFTLISIFFLICLLLLVYNIHFLALSILIVYIGAVAVLFLFSVMLIGRTNSESK